MTVHFHQALVGGIFLNHDVIEMNETSMSPNFVPSSKINSHIAHFGYTALHNVNILREPKVYKCPSRQTHDVTDDSYNANLSIMWSDGNSSGAGTYGPDQSQTELSYLYFVNQLGSYSSRMYASVANRRLLKESHYGSETSIVRDRIINHGGYDYGNVLYGDGHAESKVITGGMESSAFNGNRNDWLLYHYNPGQYFDSGSFFAEMALARYNNTANPYEGNTNGLGANGSINFFDSALANVSHDQKPTGSEFGNPPHQP